MAAMVFVWAVAAWAVAADDFSPYKYSCLHYCQSNQYGNTQHYCCRGAQVILGTVHLNDFSPTTAHSTSAATSHVSTSSTNTYTTISVVVESTVNTLETVTATPLLFNLHSLALGPPVASTIVGTLSTTATDAITTTKGMSSQERAQCPPVRNYCPREQKSAHLALCNTDYDCAVSDKCCEDTCIMARVCKTAVGTRRRRNTIQYNPNNVKNTGSAAATPVILTRDNEPLSVVVNGQGNPVSVRSGDVVTLAARDPSALFASPDANLTGASTLHKTQTNVKLSEKDQIYIIEDENGDLVVDANDNTLTLVQVGGGPTLVFNDEGIKVMTGIVSSSEWSFMGTVKHSVLPNLTIHAEKLYNKTREDSLQISARSSSIGDILTGKDKKITMRNEDSLRVMNHDGVIFVMRFSPVTGGSLGTGKNASISIVASDKINANAMIDGDGNLITDKNGLIINVKNINYRFRNAQKVLEDMVIIDGEGNTISLVDQVDRVVKLTDHNGNDVKLAVGKMTLRLQNSTGVSVRQTVNGFFVINRIGHVVEDGNGIPLRVVLLDERQPSVEYLGDMVKSMQELKELKVSRKSEEESETIESERGTAAARVYRTRRQDFQNVRNLGTREDLDRSGLFEDPEVENKGHSTGDMDGVSKKPENACPRKKLALNVDKNVKHLVKDKDWDNRLDSYHLEAGECADYADTLDYSGEEGIIEPRRLALERYEHHRTNGGQYLGFDEDWERFSQGEEIASVSRYTEDTGLGFYSGDGDNNYNGVHTLESAKELMEGSAGRWYMHESEYNSSNTASPQMGYHGRRLLSVVPLGNNLPRGSDQSLEAEDEDLVKVATESASNDHERIMPQRPEEATTDEPPYTLPVVIERKDKRSVHSKDESDNQQQTEGKAGYGSVQSNYLKLRQMAEMVAEDGNTHDGSEEYSKTNNGSMKSSHMQRHVLPHILSPSHKNESNNSSQPKDNEDKSNMDKLQNIPEHLGDKEAPTLPPPEYRGRRYVLPVEQMGTQFMHDEDLNIAGNFQFLTTIMKMFDKTVKKDDVKPKRKSYEKRQQGGHKVAHGDQPGRFPQPSSLPLQIREIGLQIMKVADKVENLNFDSPNVASKTASNFNYGVDDYEGFLYSLTHLVEEFLRQITLIIERMSSKFREIGDSEGITVVATVVMTAVMELLEIAQEIAAEAKRLSTATGHHTFYT